MLWTALTARIAMCQNAVGFEGQWRWCELPLMAKSRPPAAWNWGPLCPRQRT